MPRIQPVDPAAATDEAKKLLDGVNTALGVVPNIFATMVQSPKVLEGFLALNGALGQGLLSAGLREQIALTVAGANECDYCASAHTAIGRGAGLSADELSGSLQGQSADSRTQAALSFARKVVAQRGRIDDIELHALRNAGYSDGEVVEIVTHIGVNLFTNYFNHIAGTDIDFPVVQASGAANAA
ncbi:carboxymuconolactone decarboxylase family protein [Pelagibius sp. Alg239-R121]|uniref:carboxymuconolactone decarboxylase family protein n=1 Tax=Pelagibius sp. Alg239-R121 TaxID=2993448 RepID=UPI0024A6FE11|nr:carboxymuconolactone decarboxylase family protein [Pelagibius sp. Alg239-R121]